MQNNPLNTLMHRLDASPTPYHAVAQAVTELENAGFQKLDEAQAWDLQPGGKYFVDRRGSSLIAFKAGDGGFIESGIRVAGAHTDSPVLKVKPVPERVVAGYCQLGIEVYGGVLLAPWFDRDLSLAGRISFARDGRTKHQLIDFQRPIAVIPSLAIHLDREANSGRAINPQEQMNVILSRETSPNNEWSIRQMLSEELARQDAAIGQYEILDFDLSFYDTQRAALVGLDGAFLASARLDNLLSSFAALEAFLQSESGADSVPSVLALFDHEEVGSRSDIGAHSNFLESVLERLCGSRETLHRVLRRSTLVSVDNAHGLHPNFLNKHDASHGPLLNHGPVVKYDANQGYATSSQSSLFIKQIAKQAGVPLQSYATRADMRCGSTIGPISAAHSGIATVDLGVATFAMHSIRETAGAQDVAYLQRILRQYFETRYVSL